MSDTLPIDLNSAALGVGRHVSGIADPFKDASTTSVSRMSSVSGSLQKFAAVHASIQTTSISPAIRRNVFKQNRAEWRQLAA